MPGAAHVHRSIFTRLQSGGPTRDLSSSHSRSLSSSPLLSNPTTTTTTTTTPTFPSSSSAPLLHTSSSPVPVTSDSYHYDPVSRQTRHDDNDAVVIAPLSPWDDAPTTHGNFITPVAEKGRRRRRKTRRRYGPIIIFLLELIMCSWSIYTTIRYFVTLVQYEEPWVETLLLALGASSVLSSLSIFCCLLLASFGSRRSRLLFGPYHPAFSTLLSLLRIVSYLCLLGPAIVSFTFVFIWRGSPDPNLNLRSRCQLDVDAIWTISTNICADSAPPWAVWVALASGRLVITFAIIVIYHTITVLLPNSIRKHGHRHTSDTPPFRDNKTAAASSLAPIGGHQSSDWTLDATLVGESPTPPFSRKHLGPSRSSEMSKEGLAAELLSPPQRSSTPGAEIEGDATAASYVDRFRALITQINREMESALEIARSEGTSSIFTTEDRAYTPSSSSSHDAEHHNNDYCCDPVYNDDNNSGRHNGFGLPPLPPSLGYNEFGLPYPPDESVPMLNGFIRRMPTIESMGSGEMTTSLSSSSRPTTTGSSGTGTDGVHHPSTQGRNHALPSASNYGTTPGSGSSSRSNSLLSQAQQQQQQQQRGEGEVSVNLTTATTPRIGPITSEFGELLDRKADTRWQRLSGAPSISVGSQSSAASYHTAAMGGSYSPTSQSL